MEEACAFARRPGLLPFRLGAFKAAAEAGCPDRPDGHPWHTRDVLPTDTWWSRPGRIDVTVLPSLTTATERCREVVRLRDLAQAEIARASNEPA